MTDAPAVGPARTNAFSRTAALVVVCSVLFLTFLDTTIVSVTLGSVQNDLHAGVTSLQWVVNAYSLVFASLMLTAGTLGDRLGRKRILLAGVAIFCAGSVLAALAPSTAVLIIARAVMGLGAAASEPGTLSVIRQLYPDPSARARAVGAWAAIAGLALALGPVIGGFLVNAGSWRTVFWFNLALGLVLLVASARLLPESADPQPGRLDLAGFVLGALFLGSGAFAIIDGENAGYGAPLMVLLFAISALSLVTLLFVERRSTAPMLDLGYLTARVSGALFVGFAVYFGIFSIFFFTALYLQEVLVYSGAQVAEVFSPMAVTIVVGSAVGGQWVARGGRRGAMPIGCILAAAGILLTAHYIGPDVTYRPLALSLALAGAGFGLAIVPATTAVLAAMPPQRSGLAASTINTSRQIGAVVGVAVLGSLVNAHLTGDLRARLRALGVPADFQSIVISAIKQGSVPSGTSTASVTASYGGLVIKVLDAAYDAYLQGLRASLTVAAAAIVLAAVVAWWTSRSAAG